MHLTRMERYLGVYGTTVCDRSMSTWEGMSKEDKRGGLSKGKVGVKVPNEKLMAENSLQIFRKWCFA